ncbi:MAG: hypothetical protein Q9225_007323 [Loekoesia sp. 1 TL-2023]
MCYGPCTTYVGCGHQMLQIEAECQFGRGQRGDCSRGVFTVTRGRTSSTPSLCVHCYRRHVDDVIARYKRRIQRVDEKIEILTQKLHECTDAAERETMKSSISSKEVYRGELIDGRYDELEEFRVQQGVWGDGGLYKGYRPFGTLTTE